MKFTAEDLLACYARGVFPMADARDEPDFYLVDPKHRGVFPLDAFTVPHRLARTVRANPFEIRVDTAFSRVVLACADRDETWINSPIEQLYGQLHAMGHAHSVECWLGDDLVGGLYGVALNGAFFGESMFSRARDASKVALVHLVARLICGGFSLLDAQFITEHLKQFGARQITRAEYQRRLGRALSRPGDFQRMAGNTGGALALQLISQAS